jgi:hypothetical protein
MPGRQHRIEASFSETPPTVDGREYNHNEPVEIEAILHGGAVDVRYIPALRNALTRINP